MDWILATEGDRLFQCGIVWGDGERNSSGNQCMSDVCTLANFIPSFFRHFLISP